MNRRDMNWRKNEQALKRRYDRGTVIVFLVLGLIMIGRAAWMYMHDMAWVAFSPFYFQPIFHTPAYDAFLGIMLLSVAAGFWIQYKRKWGRKT